MQWRWTTKLPCNLFLSYVLNKIHEKFKRPLAMFLLQHSLTFWDLNVSYIWFFLYLVVMRDWNVSVSLVGSERVPKEWNNLTKTFGSFFKKKKHTKFIVLMIRTKKLVISLCPWLCFILQIQCICYRYCNSLTNIVLVTRLIIHVHCFFF